MKKFKASDISLTPGKIVLVLDKAEAFDFIDKQMTTQVEAAGKIGTPDFKIRGSVTVSFDSAFITDADYANDSFITVEIAPESISYEVKFDV